MKKVHKTKAGKGSPKLKRNARLRRAASKTTSSNGNHLSLTFDRLPIGIVESSPEGKYINVNEEFCRLTGYNKDELLRLGIKDLTHEEDFSVDIKLHQKLILGEIPFYKLEKRYVRKDGGIIWTELTRSVVRDSDGNSLYTIGAVLDATERKQAEEERSELLKSERAARTHAEQAKVEAERELAERKKAEQALGRWASSPLPDESRPAWMRYGAALVATALAILPRVLFHPVLGDFVPLSTLFGAVAFSVWYGGAGPALLSIIAGYLGAEWFIMEPQHTMSFDLANITGLGLFLLSGLIVIGLGEAMRRAQRHAHQSAGVATERQQQAEARLAEQKRVEESLRASEEKYRRIVETANEGIWEIDKDTRTVFVNARMAEMLGYGVAEMMDRSPFEFMLPEDHLEGEHRLESAKRGIPARGNEFRYRCKDGSVLWTAASNTPKLDAQGNFLGAFAMISDITELKQREDEIQRLNTELQAQVDELNILLEILPTGVWIGNHDCSVITGNPAAYRMLGLPPGANVSVNNPEPQLPSGLHLFIEGKEVEPEDGPMQQVARTGKPLYNVEHEILFPDGTLKTMHTNVVPLLNEDGAVRKVIGSYVDFTERRLAEKRLTLLTEISELIRIIEDSSELMFAVSKTAGEHLQVSRCLFNETDLENDREIVHRDYYNGVESVAGIHKMSDYSTITSAEMKAGKTVVNIDSKIDPRTAQDYEKTYAANKERAYVAVPLMREHQWVGTFWVSDSVPRRWSKEEISLLETIAERTWTAVERLRIAEALRQSEARFAQFMQHLPGLAWIKDMQGRYVFANAAAEKAFRTPREELYGKTDQEVFPAEVATQFKLNDERALMEGKDIQVIETLEQEDGVLHYSLVSKFPIPGPDGNIAWIGGTAFDITERLRAEEALRESEERERVRAAQLEAIMEAVPAVIWIAHDPECRVITGNRASSDILRLPPNANPSLSAGEGIRPTNFEVLYDGQVLQPEELPVQRAARGEDVRNFEEEVRFDNGTSIYLFGNATPLRDAQNNPSGAVAAFVDITARKQAEEALRDLNMELEARVERRTAQLQTANQSLLNEIADRRQAEELLRNWAHIFEHADWGIATLHEEIYVMVNPSYAKMHGYTVAELVGRPNEDVFPPKTYADVQDQLHLAYEKGHYVFETLHMRKDGTIFPVVIDTSVVKDPQGNILYRAINVQDITERKRIEDALRLNEEKLRTLFEIVPVGISFLNYEAQVIQVNSALEKMLGRPKEKLLRGEDKTIKYIRADGTPMLRTEFASTRAMREQETIHNVETGVVKENGEIAWMNISAAPVAVADVGAVVVTADITKRKRAEQALHESRARLQELSKRLVEVQEEERRALARELHDSVGQSLSALNLNLVMIRDQLSEASLQKIGPRLEDSMQLAKEAVGLVRNVMTDLRPAVLDDYGLEAAMNSYIDQFTSRYNIKVLFEHSDMPLPRQSPSREMTLLRISQEALTNIARHARADQVNLSLELAEKAIRLTVEDNGVGIPSWEEANRPGSHGLTIMRERAEAFDGVLRVESAPGKGTKIEASIPIENGDQAEAQKERYL